MCVILAQVLRKHHLTEKCVGFSADNCATNFGSIDRGGQNNVFALLRKELGEELMPLGCPVHVIHNTAKIGLQRLSHDSHALVVSLHSYFNTHTLRVTNLTLICEENNMEFKPALKHSGTRWLGLKKCSQRIIEMFEPLKKFFGNEPHPPKGKNFLLRQNIY